MYELPYTNTHSINITKSTYCCHIDCYYTRYIYTQCSTWSTSVVLLAKIHIGIKRNLDIKFPVNMMKT